jgi:signal peptidase
VSATLATEAPVVVPDVVDVSRPRAARQAWNLFTGSLLIVAMTASVALAFTVVHERIGFQPVLSPSMVPTFRPGDLLLTKAEPASAVKVGQVVELPIPNEPGQRYSHRIISVTMKDGKPVVRTKGDANPAPESFSLRIDSPTVPVVIATVPGVGRLSVVLQRRWLRLLIAALTIGFGVVAAKRLVQSVRRPDDLTGIEDNQ